MRLVSTNSFKDNMFMFITQHTHGGILRKWRAPFQRFFLLLRIKALGHMHLVSPSSHLNMFNAPFEGILQGYTHGVFIIELYRASVMSTMHACDLVRNMSLFPLQLTNTLSKAFLCSPPALHCLKTSWDTSSFPLAGLGEHTLRSVCRWIHPARSLHHMSHAAKALTLRWHVFQKPPSRNRWNLRTSSIYGNLAKMAMIP